MAELRSCVICSSPNPVDDQVEGDKSCTVRQAETSAYRIVVGTYEGKTPVGGSKNRGQKNIKSELKERSVDIFYNGEIL